jgi:energy-converting hydrogenase Eha subunit H
LAFSWISTFIIACLQVFLFVWTCVQRKRQPEISAYKSNIKAHYVDGQLGTGGGETVMASVAIVAPLATSQTLTPVIVAEPAKALAKSI